MKKGIILLTMLALLLSFGITAAATPNGLTTTPVYNFDNIADGESTLLDIGCWLNNAATDNSPVTVSGGKITIQNATWGAFPNLSDDQVAIFAGKDGLAFYFKAGDTDAKIAYGFNDTAKINHVLADSGKVLLESLDGTVTEVNLENVSNFGQGGFTIPANFEGYIYIPFENFRQNANRGVVFDYENQQIATIIFAIAQGNPVTYGEVLAYTGTYTPADPGSDTADISTVTYAFAAAVSLGSLTVLRKKR